MYNILSIILISFLGSIVYSNSFFCPFQFDDFPTIVNNPSITNIYNLQNIWAYTPCRFITFLSLALNYHFHQLNVFGYHLFNLAVHLMSSILVWQFTRLTLSTPVMRGNKMNQHANPIALLAALVFVSHPVQTEAVTYIWQRATSMGALFYLASLVLYVKSRLLEEKGKNPSIEKFYYTCSLMIAVLAMFTKENTVTLPLMILLYEFSFLESGKGLNWKRLLPFLLTMFIIPLTMLFPRSDGFQGIHSLVEGPKGISPIHYFLTQLRVMITYIRLLFLPINQNLDYDYHISKSIFEWPTLFSFWFLVFVLLGARHLFSRYRMVSFSIFWFFLTLVPESSFLPLNDVIFEHRLYLPMVGYGIFLASSAYYLHQNSAIKTIVILLMAVITFNSILTYQRNKVWRDGYTLWNDTAQKSPHKVRPYNNRGLAYYRQGKFAQALLDFNKAIYINPDFAEGYNNRSVLYALKGNFIQALSDSNKAIKLDPHYADAYYNRGNTYNNHHDFNRAMSDYSKAIEISPDFAGAYYNRASVYESQGDFVQAISDYSKAIEINPAFAMAYYNRGIIYVKQENLTKAISDYTKAVDINPNYAGAYNNRGFIYGLQGDLVRAMSDFNKVIEIEPDNAEAYNNRANIYYQSKEYNKAWGDVHRLKELGGAVNPGFLSELKLATGKDE